MTLAERFADTEAKSKTLNGWSSTDVPGETPVGKMERWNIASYAYNQAVIDLNRSLKGKAYLLPDGRVLIPVSDNSYRVYDQIVD